jgi:hypothetical protein
VQVKKRTRRIRLQHNLLQLTIEKLHQKSKELTFSTACTGVAAQHAANVIILHFFGIQTTQ